MTVKELIEKLQTLPQDAECYKGEFCGFLDDDLKRTNPIRITDKEHHDVYDLDCEYKTVYTFHRGQWKEYTGVIFETD